MSVQVTTFLLLLVPIAWSFQSGSKSKAQVVQDYVLAANFDDSPQLRRRKYDKAFEEGIERKEDATGLGAYYGDTEAKDRDLIVPGHLPPHPPPPPPPSAISPYSVFAVGFISFLILLSSLQASLTMMIEHNGGLLGGLTKPAGRKKRGATGEGGYLRGRGKRASC